MIPYNWIPCIDSFILCVFGREVRTPTSSIKSMKVFFFFFGYSTSYCVSETPENIRFLLKFDSMNARILLLKRIRVKMLK